MVPHKIIQHDWTISQSYTEILKAEKAEAARPEPEPQPGVESEARETLHEDVSDFKTVEAPAQKKLIVLVLHKKIL